MLNYIKHNYFEILTVIVLVIAGATRVIFPDIREKEAAHLPFGSETIEWAIILFELASPYFLLIAPQYWKHSYLVFLVIGLIILTSYYVVTCMDLLDFRHVCIYTNTPLAVVLHGVYIMIFIWLAFLKG